jgi:hypothetical protein
LNEGNRCYFLQVTPHQDDHGLDWLIVTVVPESDFMARVYADVRRTMGFSALALVSAIALSIWIARHVTRSILALDQATQAFAAGHSLPITPSTRIREVESLRQTFLQMVVSVQTADQLRQSYERNLELQVAEKTVALQSSEANLKAAQRIAKVGSWEFDVTTGQSTWSKELFRIVGWKPDASQAEIKLDEILDLLLPDDRDVFRGTMATAIAQGTPYKIELRVRHADGKIRYLVSRGEPVHNDQGQVVKLVGTVADISDHKRLEQELIRNRDFRELLFNESNDALFLVDPTTVRTLDCNQRAVELFEVDDKDELIDIEGHILQKRQFTAEELVSIAEQLEQQGFWSREVEYITRKGREFWGDLSAKRIVFGEQYFNLVRVIDISDRKQAEIALQRTTKELQTLLDCAPIFIALFDADGRYLRVNPALADLIGISADTAGTAIEKNFTDVFPDSVVEIFNARIQQLISTRQPLEVEDELMINGHLKTFESVLFPVMDRVRNPEEIPKTFWAIAVDISQRKQAEHQIQMALAEKEILLQEIHHRVKNNLQLIQSMLRMQQRRIHQPEAVQILQDSRDRIMAISLVHEILYQSDNLSQIDLADYVPAIVQQITAFYRMTHPKLDVQTQVQHVMLPVQKAVCCGLILNELVTNAMKYAFPGQEQPGQIWVALEVTQAAVTEIYLSVGDNGVGLPADFSLAKLNTLGLNLVQDLVQQLQGSLAVDSDSGTEFNITFQVKRDDTTS